VKPAVNLGQSHRRLRRSEKNGKPQFTIVTDKTSIPAGPS